MLRNAAEVYALIGKSLDIDRDEEGDGMKYPHVNNYLKYYRNPDGKCRVVDYCTDQEYEMEYDTACILREMNGHRPLSSVVSMSRQECDDVEDELLKLGLLRKNRLEVDGPGCIRVALWMASGWSQKRWKGIALHLHRFVRITWFPVLVVGLAIWSFVFHRGLYSGTFYSSPSWTVTGYFLGILLGLFLHELSHAASAVTYGATVFEIGVGLTFFIPCGYVIMDESQIKGRTLNTQMILAGIKMNFLLGGSSLLLSFCFPFAWDFWVEIAIVNLIMGFSNLIVSGNTDGFFAISTMLGIPQTWSFEDRIKIVLGMKRIRKAKRINIGILRIALLLLILFQTGFVLVIMYEVWSLIGIFIG